MAKKASSAGGDIKLYKELMRLRLAVISVMIICAGLVFYVWRVTVGDDATRMLVVFVPFLIAAIVLALMSSFLNVEHVKALSNTGLLPGAKLWQRDG